MVFTMVLWSWDAYSISTAANAAIFKDLLRLACLVFATPVVLILGKPLVANVASQFHRRLFTADGLLVLGVMAAYLYSVVSIVTGGEHVYFEVACMILLAVTVGRWLEAEGKQRAMKSLETLRTLLPETARVVNGRETTETPLDAVQREQTIRVVPGERIPLDGDVVSGKSFVDERLVSGESEPRQVDINDSVFGGTANLDGVLDIQVTASAQEGVIQRLVQSVREAAQHRSRPERLADRLATVLACVIAVVVVPVFTYHFAHGGFQTAMMSSMSVVLIACPCGLAVATPLAVWSALSQAAAHGVVFRSSDDMLQLAKIDFLCLDKTGTVTSGEPTLVRSVWADDATPFATEPQPTPPMPASAPLRDSVGHHNPGLSHGSRLADDQDSIGAVPARTAEASPRVAWAIQVTRQLAMNTQHPLAEGLASQLMPDGVDGIESAHSAPEMFDPQRVSLKNLRTIPGRGVTASLVAPGPLNQPERHAVLGNEALCRERQLDFPPAIRDALDDAKHRGLSTVLFGWEASVFGCFVFRESFRDDAKLAMARLNELKIPILLLTGDRHERANAVASELGINVAAERLPEEKRAFVQSLQAKGHHVAMVGDGLNDAPVLSQADVGIAMGCGVEVSRDAADVCLLASDELQRIPWAIQLARGAQRTIAKNLFWAVAYNSVGIVVAASGRLNPIFAAAAMVLSSLLVISESLKFKADPCEPDRRSNDTSTTRPSSETDRTMNERRSDND